MILVTAQRAACRRKGLSLIEILLGLAILVMSLAAIGVLVNMGTDFGNRARLNTAAARLAQSKLAELEAGVLDLTETGGVFEGDDAGWQWTLNAQQQGPTLFLVTLTVSRDIRGRLFEFTVSQYMLDPAIRGSATEVSRPSGTTMEEMP